MLDIREQVSLKDHTVFKIGGPAKYFCEAKTAEELKDALAWARGSALPFFVLGAGSNVLVSDNEFEGLVIKNKATNIKINPLGYPVAKWGVEAEAGLAPQKLYAEAGAQMARVVAESVKAGLSGFEWAIGIPGTIGGSVRGNAGCFGSEMKDVIESVEVFDFLDAKRRTLEAGECNFGYRHSVFKEKPNLIVLSATLRFAKGDPKKSQGLIAEYSKKRLSSQDIGAKCAGCIFKNVEWSRKDVNKESLLQKYPELKPFSGQKSIPAGFLLDFLGLKGTKAGAVQISEKHANYFINLGGATAAEVIALINTAKEKIQNRYGISLEEEIQKINC
ncbi:MAG: UDP-N-acetylenolpyruvoylglucosamine reductase [Candidatus Ryanbacteria bacterium RIFCSPHIGHO2_01_FULL_48_27]|uniref:UDP-N-acetylenolpyruvoylglucosamine reductase n=1 Tax=Candidatus Ryanbacteria bacterium RIFCSPHIGHO2_01_FULL_48_27 TaxID=1802115 RepID=A0A1G2G841_9BACT|nr:MAG: UDP-N-acetylenolpyruvoylglucosamine reductase [Candidatus Ryanbacteria bacterium RIFCSPHIGHO2_01_FULL_48_27]